MRQELFQAKADLLKALSHPTRLQILEFLREGERCVCELVPLLGLEQPNISQHLSIMRAHGIVAYRREGTRLLYRLKHHDLAHLAALVDNIIAAQWGEKGRVLARSAYNTPGG